MLPYIARRIIWTLPVLLFVAVLTFVLMHSVPGGPWDSTRPMREETRENLDREYGLDRPVWYQFGAYMYGLAQGDLGVSFQQRNRPVRELLAEKMLPTVTLGLTSLAVSLTIGVALGSGAALRRGRALDYGVAGLATFGASVPSLILGMLMLAVLSGHLHWLPASGWGSIRQGVMPVIALSTLPTAYISRVTRASVLEVLDQDYIKTARAKGLQERAIVLRHLLKNAAIPILSVAGPLATTLITGLFVVEQLFSIPGTGRELVASISARDYGVIMGITLFYTFVVAMANLTVDVLYAWVDPRIRLEAQG